MVHKILPKESNCRELFTKQKPIPMDKVPIRGGRESAGSQTIRFHKIKDIIRWPIDFTHIILRPSAHLS